MPRENPESVGEWSGREAWLLLAIGDHKRVGCDLTGLLMSAHKRMGAIPTEEACASILGTLIGSGLVEMHYGKFRLTGTSRKIVKGVGGAPPDDALALAARAMRRVGRTDRRFRFAEGEYAAASSRSRSGA